MRSHRVRAASATSTTSVNGAPLGSRSRTHQSGRSRRRRSAGPEVERNRAQVDDVEQRGQVVADEIVDLALRVLAPHALGPDPVGREARRVLLEEGLARDAVGIARHHQRPVAEIRQQPGSDGAVVGDQVALGVAVLGPEDLLEVGELEGQLAAVLARRPRAIRRQALRSRRRRANVEPSVGGPPDRSLGGDGRHRPPPAPPTALSRTPPARLSSRKRRNTGWRSRPSSVPRCTRPRTRAVGSTQVVPRSLGTGPTHGASARRCDAERAAHLGELLLAEPGAHPAGVGQHAVHVLGQMQRAEAAARPLGRGESHHHEVAGEPRADLEPERAIGPPCTARRPSWPRLPRARGARPRDRAPRRPPRRARGSAARPAAAAPAGAAPCGW